MSKTISIMRHAMSSGGSFTMPDIERFVLPEGITQTEYVAGKMVANDLIPDAIWTSPAKRTQQTSQLIHHLLQLECDLEIKTSLYHEDDEYVIEQIISCDEDFNHLLIIGHNPMVTQLTCQLSGTGGFGWFNTSDIVSIEFDTENWAEIQTSKIIRKLKITPLRN